jgi:hypothetical protein
MRNISLEPPGHVRVCACFEHKTVILHDGTNGNLLISERFESLPSFHCVRDISKDRNSASQTQFVRVKCAMGLLNHAWQKILSCRSLIADEAKDLQFV